jgi:anti-anti-sigma regulatory factor
MFMTHRPLPVAVLQLPHTFNAERHKIFLCDLENRMDAIRPRVVLDCSNLRDLGSPTIHLLLCCLEEAMKRNGDIRLAAIPPGASMIFDFSDLYGLFEIFDTVSGAVDSFRQVALDGIVQKNAAGTSHSNGDLLSEVAL